MSPRYPKEIPKEPQEPPRSSQGVPKRPQRSPKSHQGAPEASQRSPRDSPKHPRKLQNGACSPQEAPHRKRKAGFARDSSESTRMEVKLQYSHEKTSIQKVTVFEILTERGPRSNLRPVCSEGPEKPVLAWKWEAHSNNEKTKQF